MKKPLSWRIVGIRSLTATQHIPYFGQKYFVSHIPASDNVSFMTFRLRIIKSLSNIL